MSTEDDSHLEAPTPGEPRQQEEQALLVDVGNTNVVFGVLRQGQLLEPLRLATERERTADEYGALLLPLFHHLGLDPLATQSMLVSSVVPPLDQPLERLAKRYFGVEARFVGRGVHTGMVIRYDHPEEVGADRIVNAVAASHRFGSPVVVADFGTATTFDVVNPDGEYAGGIIAPGLGISAEALFSRASRLWRVGIERPAQLVGGNTAAAMQSGIYFGYVGLVDGILERLRDEIPGVRTVVATGGQAEMIARDSRHIDQVDPSLTLRGLQILHERNRPA